MATRNSGYAGQPFNKFYTPAWVVSRDLAHQWVPPRNCEFWEPCAGNGQMARAISKAFGQACLATDIEPDRRQLAPVVKHDFLSSSGPSRSAEAPLVIITNPPYGFQSRLAVRFLIHALGLTERSGGSVCFLMPFAFDAARGRAGLVGYHPAFATKITTSERIRWSNIPQKASGPSGDHAWFIYEWQARRRNAWALKQLQVAG
jgi:hypothetical protein